MNDTLLKGAKVVIVGGIGLIAYLAYKFLIKGAVFWALLKLGVPSQYAGLAAFVMGAFILYAIATLGAPLWTRIGAWADKDDPMSGTTSLAEHASKRNETP